MAWRKRTKRNRKKSRRRKRRRIEEDFVESVSFGW